MPRLPSVRRADVWVAVLATALQMASPRPGSAPPPPDVLTGVLVGALAIAAALVQGVALLRRRSRPVVVLGVCVAAYVISLATAPGVPPYAAWFALFAAGVYARPTRRAGHAVAAGSAALIAIVLAGALLSDTGAGDVIVIVLATVIVALVATLVRSRRAQLEALRERADALQRESESAAARAAAEERLRIARDIHDLVGHGLSGIAVQSSTARLALEAGRIGQAATALSAVESSSRSALQEMRRLVGVLRADDDGDRGPTPGLDDLPDLIERVRAQGVPVEVSSAGLGDLPPAVSLCAYRVVQEALTNAVRHAPGSRVTVGVTATTGHVVVAVEDFSEGAVRTPSPSAAGGHGLVGMRERVAALGGELSAGPATDHPGWRVLARIPSRAGDLR